MVVSNLGQYCSSNLAVLSSSLLLSSHMHMHIMQVGGSTDDYSTEWETSSNGEDEDGDLEVRGGGGGRVEEGRGGRSRGRRGKRR